MNLRTTCLALLCTLTGCGGGMWSLGLPDDSPAAANVVPNGVVLSTGPAAWLEAAQRTTLAWNDLLPEGVTFDSAAPASEVPGALPMTAVMLPQWVGATLRPGHVGLDVGPTGLVVDIEVDIEPVIVTFEDDAGTACLVEVTIQGGRLNGTLTLTKSKLGVIKLAPVGDAWLRETDALFTLSACREPYALLSGALDGPEMLALEALAEASFAALVPSMSAAIPTCLGLDLAGATTVAYEDAGLGAGWHHTVVRAPLVAPTPWWQFASGRLVVPYSVGITAQSHACVPDDPLPVAMSAAVPVVDSDWALLVNQQVIARQVAAVWKAGGLCGDRVAGSAIASASEWSAEWSGLHDMDPEMSISARLWADSAPRLSFSGDDGRTHVKADVDVGIWRVELMGWRDGARVRLATVRAAIAVRASVIAEPTGEIWLSIETVDVTVVESEAGLLSPPSDTALSSYVDTIVRGALQAAPLWSLPAVPAGVTPTVELYGDYLVIRDA